MKTIIIGLGNPGTKFKNTRHNVGFMAIDKFAKKNDFPEFKLQKKSNSLISEKPFGTAQDKNNNVLLVKPQTFMNNSGSSVKKIITGYRLPVTGYLIVAHDDVDLPLGKIKISKDRGSAGHKGVESIIQAVGNENLIRVRIGIGQEKKPEAKNIVLKNFTSEEQKIVDSTIEKTAEAIDTLIKEGLEKAMNEYNK